MGLFVAVSPPLAKLIADIPEGHVGFLTSHFVIDTINW